MKEPRCRSLSRRNDINHRSLGRAQTAAQEQVKAWETQREGEENRKFLACDVDGGGPPFETVFQ